MITPSSIGERQPPSPRAGVDAATDPDWSEAKQPWLACELAAVREHFRHYGLLDGRVHFLPGLLAETLPRAPIQKLALLCIDVCLFRPTTEALERLYGRVEPGGFVVLNDYDNLRSTRDALDAFRAERGIDTPLSRIDRRGVFWRKDP